jgi:hypothetical protein
MIMAKDTEARDAALKALLPYQREDFKGILEAMPGRTVTVISHPHRGFHTRIGLFYQCFMFIILHVYLMPYNMYIICILN